MSIEELEDENPNALLADGFERAYLGICYRACQPPVASYDYDKCLEILVGQGMDYEAALEFFEFNTIGAWVGPNTPVFIKLRPHDQTDSRVLASASSGEALSSD